MRFFLRGLLASVLLLPLTVLPVRACINDSEINKEEREFKSSYEESSVPQPESPPAPAPTVHDRLLVGVPVTVGAFLLVGAVIVVVRRTGDPNT